MQFTCLYILVDTHSRLNKFAATTWKSCFNQWHWIRLRLQRATRPAWDFNDEGKLIRNPIRSWFKNAGMGRWWWLVFTGVLMYISWRLPNWTASNVLGRNARPSPGPGWGILPDGVSAWRVPQMPLNNFGQACSPATIGGTPAPYKILCRPGTAWNGCDVLFYARFYG